MASLLKASRSLLGYTVWANRSQLAALTQIAPEDLVRDTGASFGSLLWTMGHLVGMERTWLARFLGNPLDPAPGPETYPDLPALWAAFDEHAAELEFYIASLTEDQLDLEVSWTSRAGEGRQQKLWQTLVHMVNHSTYHRGQVVTLLRQLGYQPPASDLTAYFALHPN